MAISMTEVFFVEFTLAIQRYITQAIWFGDGYLNVYYKFCLCRFDQHFYYIIFTK